MSFSKYLQDIQIILFNVVVHHGASKTVLGGGGGEREGVHGDPVWPMDYTHRVYKTCLYKSAICDALIGHFIGAC